MYDLAEASWYWYPKLRGINKIRSYSWPVQSRNFHLAQNSMGVIACFVDAVKLENVINRLNQFFLH